MKRVEEYLRDYLIWMISAVGGGWQEMSECFFFLGLRDYPRMLTTGDEDYMNVRLPRMATTDSFSTTVDDDLFCGGVTP